MSQVQETFITRLADQLARALPPAVSTMTGEVAEHLRQALREGLARMDLVTREEFEVQAQVLEKTRKRLDQLEDKLRRLEQL